MNTPPVFANFSVLKANMEEEGWVIEAFNFQFKATNFIVLVKLYQKGDPRPEYSLLEVEFIKENNLDKSLKVAANSYRFLNLPTKTLRAFFGIEYSENLGDILKQFSEYFGSCIPTEINPNKSENLKITIVKSLSKSDSEDPNKIYCYTTKRNPDNQQRSPFNDNKTKTLRPNLYSKFEKDPAISFWYSTNKNDEKTDEEILYNFSQRT